MMSFTFYPNEFSDMKNPHLEFLTMAGSLKTVFRHSWLTMPPLGKWTTPATNKHAEKLTAYRRESTADHSWRITLMALLWAEQLDTKINKDHAIKIALVHDIAEALAGDIPVHQPSASAKSQHKAAEIAAIEKMLAVLTKEVNSHEIYSYWQEYLEQKTAEARFVKAIDKLEAFIQHNEDPIETWEPHEMRMLFQKKWLLPFCQYDSFLKNIAEEVLAEGISKLVQGGFDVETIKKAALAEE
jgi:putative hydrolase of HD superfamily